MMIDNDVFKRDEVIWNPEDDASQKAYKAGFKDSYFGISGGYSVEEELDMYEIGRTDGQRERQAILRQGLEDPHNW